MRKSGRVLSMAYKGTKASPELLGLLKEELSEANPKRSYYMDQALNYFDHFK